jgi:hypothetical protein
MGLIVQPTKKGVFMKTRIWLLVAAAAICSGMLQSCRSFPAKLIVEPGYYEDESIRIDYRIGLNVYFIEILNKTETEIVVDPIRSSIISIANQTRSLNLKQEDSHIPPKAALIIRPNQSTIFGTDIDSVFKPPAVQFSEFSPLTEKEYLKQYVGSNIRIYMPLAIGGKERVYDIILSIKNVTQEGTF